MSRRDSFIVNVCLTGMVPTKGMNPHVPMTPTEIAGDVEACVALGASMVHVHAHDEQGAPDWRRETYQPILDAVRRAAPEVIICVSTSGRSVSEIEKRAAGLLCEPAPDMGTLMLGSINFRRDASMNPWPTITALAAVMRAHGIRPELEVFDVGMARTAARLVADGILQAPLYANLFLATRRRQRPTLWTWRRSCTTCRRAPSGAWAGSAATSWRPTPWASSSGTG